MNPALLLVVLLLTPTTLREDKNFLEDEITLLEKRIIEIEDQINEIDITIEEKNQDVFEKFTEYKKLKKELRDTPTTGNHYEALISHYDESKNVYNYSIDALDLLLKDRKELYVKLSDVNTEFQIKTESLEKLEKVKLRAPSNWISITLSKTCQQLINANMSSNCPTYSQVVDVYDNTIPNISGGFIPTDFDVKREKAPIKEHWKYYDSMMAGQQIIAVDPSAEFMQRSTIIEIQSNEFITYSLFGSHVNSFVNGTIPIYKNIKISDSCDMIITAPNYESVAYAVQLAKTGCDAEILPSGYIVQQYTPLNRADSAWYQFESWLKEIKINCLGLC